MNLTFRLFLLLITFKYASGQNNPVSVLNQKITVEAQDETTLALLKRIEKQTGKTFSYDSKIIDSNKKRTVVFKEKTVHEIIASLFDNKISCKAKGNYIVLYKPPLIPAYRISQESAPVKKTVVPAVSAPADSRPFLKPSKTRNDTTVRYFIDIIVPNSSGKDSVIRTESIEVPTTHVLQIKDDTTIILLKKDTIQN